MFECTTLFFTFGILCGHGAGVTCVLLGAIFFFFSYDIYLLDLWHPLCTRRRHYVRTTNTIPTEFTRRGVGCNAEVHSLECCWLHGVIAVGRVRYRWKEARIWRSLQERERRGRGVRTPSQRRRGGRWCIYSRAGWWVGWVPRAQTINKGPTLP